MRIIPYLDITFVLRMKTNLDHLDFFGSGGVVAGGVLTITFA